MDRYIAAAVADRKACHDRRLVTRGDHDGERYIAGPMREVVQDGHRRRIRPLDVVDQQDARHADHGVVDPFDEARGRGGIRAAVVDAPGRVDGESVRPGQGCHQREERQGGAGFDGCACERTESTHGGRVRDRREKPRLADPGLAEDQDEGGFAGERAVKDGLERRHLRGSSEHARRVHPHQR